MERLTGRYETGVVHVPQGMMPDALDRLAAYEDTGLTPEEIERIVDAYGRGHTLRTESALRLEMIRDIPIDRLWELADADREGRLLVLDEPKRPLVWGDEYHNAIHCPNCDSDLMGGYELAEPDERIMHQCPYCGLPIDVFEAVSCEEADAALKGEGNG